MNEEDSEEEKEEEEEEEEGLFRRRVTENRRHVGANTPQFLGTCVGTCVGKSVGAGGRKDKDLISTKTLNFAQPPGMRG